MHESATRYVEYVHLTAHVSPETSYFQTQVLPPTRPSSLSHEQYFANLWKDGQVSVNLAIFFSFGQANSLTAGFLFLYVAACVSVKIGIELNTV